MATRKIKKNKKAIKKTTVKKVALKVQKPVGKVTHFFNNISVAIVKFNRPIKAGTVINFKSATTDFQQSIESMQYDHQAIKLAPKNKEVGVRVKKRVREEDKLYLK